MIQNPCKDCDERQVGCHSTCTKGYIEWSARRKVLKAEDAKKHKRRRWIPNYQYFSAEKRFYKKGR